MNHALLIGVRYNDGGQSFEPGPSLVAMESLLDDLGGWTVLRLEGDAATRVMILTHLQELERAVGPGDAVLFYFYGHGGVTRFTDLEGALGDRPVFYLAGARRSGEWYLEGVLDIELSAILARLDAVCGNVSALLDCCYSARMIRASVIDEQEAPTWVNELSGSATAADSTSYDSESHRNIVRLAATSSMRMAFSDRASKGGVGRLTSAFVGVVREAMAKIDRLVWETIVCRVRERAIWSLGCEEQWVSFAGPRHRVLFSREQVDLPATAGFVPQEGSRAGWLRAGLVHGVVVGDEWDVAELTLDERLKLTTRARMRVTAVDLNRAQLARIDMEHTDLEPGSTAFRSDTRPVQPVEARDLLTLADAQHDRGREQPLRIRWVRCESMPRGEARNQLRTDDPTLRLHVGDRVEFEISLGRSTSSWYLSLIEIGPDGRPRLLSRSEPDGLELLPGETVFVGRAPDRKRNGIELVWPRGLAQRELPVRILILASLRPVSFEHLIDGGDAIERLGRAATEPRRAVTRRHRPTPRPRAGPELSMDWFWRSIYYRLTPEPRVTSFERIIGRRER